MIGPRSTGDVPTLAALLGRIRTVAPRLSAPVTFMEVCGTHTHAIGAMGLRAQLPPNIRLVSGPGCPVCVTPIDYLDRAEALCRLPDTCVCTFGDLFRVPSSRSSLELLAAEGYRATIVYSPADALAKARENPAVRVIFLALGFETTAPAIAAVLQQAEAESLENFLILPGNKSVMPALRALAGDPEIRLDGLLLPGHVSVITGWEVYQFLADEFRVPGAVAGFSPTDILRAVLDLTEQVAEGRTAVTNCYERMVTGAGNRAARALMETTFERTDAAWRGLGVIPQSGLGLGAHWAHRDASSLAVEIPEAKEPPGCRCGAVLKGQCDPPDCPLFAKRCTPDHPIGACMVSSEGSCAAWYRHEARSLVK